ncbi:MAG: glycerate kinase [Planctomycetota bacterium]|jgi:glycerate-2-kinase
MTSHRLIDDALAIWRAGVNAVRADRVVARQVRWDGAWLTIDETSYDLRGIERVVVVGAGKATYGMLMGLADGFARGSHPALRVSGWVNVPDGVADSKRITFGDSGWVDVCEARPQGVNEPTQRVIEGSRRILDLVRAADHSTIVLALWSGGGSALFCMPQPWLSLDTKIAITRRLSASGADIQALNEVRRCLSQVKGGRLARACRARLLVGLIISDVLGDPLPIIASGPTVLEPSPDPKLAAEILEGYCPGVFDAVIAQLRASSARDLSSGFATGLVPAHHVLANNATAVDAAGTHAVALGYRYWMHSAKHSEGPAEHVGEQLARQLIDSQRGGLVDCIITGGEPTVVLPPESIRGRGGRNQQLVLSAGRCLIEHCDWRSDFALLSGGTDGEDGPTQAAGAWIDRAWVDRYASQGATVVDHLRRCDAGGLFEESGHRLVTGPTHTNVCDLRVALTGKSTR